MILAVPKVYDSDIYLDELILAELTESATLNNFTSALVKSFNKRLTKIDKSGPS